MFTTDDPHNIDYDKLPDRFVIKTNHASGTNIIVIDKSLIDKDEINQKLTNWLKMNYADSSGEMQYYNIKPQILVEEYLEDDGDKFLIDYKFWCFNGEVEFMNIQDSDYNSEKGFHFDRYCFSLYFKPASYFNENGPSYDKFKKPISLDLMIQNASKLSEGFPFVRVDFYEIDGKPVFGEMTLTPTAGNNYYLSQDAQIKFGELMDLNLINKI